MAFRKTIFASIAMAAAFGAAQAQATDFRFTYGAHELQTAQGRENVLKRIDRTAAQACKVAAKQPLSQWLSAKKCRDELVAEMVAKIDDPRLTAVYEETFAVAQRQ